MVLIVITAVILLAQLVWLIREVDWKAEFDKMKAKPKEETTDDNVIIVG